MRALDIIAKKRDGGVLSAEEIDFFIQGATRREIPDYQIAAWLMAVYLRGMNKGETINLTLSMARSGKTLDLKDVVPFVVDKHSTGGVGDKTTLVVAPLVAATGLPVAKMSGRGLGFTGGTLDKLESFPGFRVDLSEEEFKANLRRHGIVLAGQSPDLAPADGVLYALRDATATVDCFPLIVSSVMSKKLASGADAIVLDVKAGSGAFMKTVEDARALAEFMVEIGTAAGKLVSAVISDMEQPLGLAVGNALEVKEAIATLNGQGPIDFLEHSLVVAGQMLILADRARGEDDARQMLLEVLQTRKARDKLRDLVVGQGGDPRPIDAPGLLPQAPLQIPLPSPTPGYIAKIDALQVGLAAVDLGAGRSKKGETIDHAVGIVLHRKVGERVEKDQPLLTVHARDEASAGKAEERLLQAYSFSEKRVEPPPLIRGIIPRKR